MKSKAPAAKFGPHGKVENRKRTETSPGPGQYGDSVLVRPKQGPGFGVSERPVLKKLSTDVVGPGSYVLPSDFKKGQKVKYGFGHARKLGENEKGEKKPSPSEYYLKGDFERCWKLNSSRKEQHVKRKKQTCCLDAFQREEIQG